MVETSENYIKPVLRLTSPIPPSQNHYLGWRAIMKNGKPIVVSYETAEAKKYKQEFKKHIEEQVKLQNWNYKVNNTQHFYVDAIFYFDRIDKDTSNADKCLLDTITETQLIWKDDNVACFRPNRIYYDSNNSRIELIIYPVDYIGIFDNKEQLDNFENKCKTCSRYTRNCSIFKKAKEGRIQEEIQNLECSKYKKLKD